MNRSLSFLMCLMIITASCRSFVYQTSVQKPVQETLLNISFKNLPGTADEIYMKSEKWLKSTLGNHPKCCMLLNDRNKRELSGKYLLYCNETSYGTEVYSDILILIDENQTTISFRLCDPKQCMGIRDGVYYSFEEALSDSNLLSNRFESYLRGK